MSKLTLDEAIKHCEEVAEQNESSAITYKNCKEIKANMYEKLTAEKAENDCRECAADHRQLAEWLTELKDLREENKVLISECDRLIKEKEELNKLKEKAVLDICRREARLKEAKRLLKSAIDEWNFVCEWGNCGEYCSWFENGKCTQEWSGKAEALKLIGGNEDENSI